MKGRIDYPDSYFQGHKAVYVDAVHGSLLMVDAVKMLGCGGYDEEVFLYLVNPKAPCFIRDEKESYIYLILPVNFNAIR